MGRRYDLIAAQAAGAPQLTGAATNYLVQATNGYLYLVYVDSNTDVAFRRSPDKGLTWGTPTVVFTGTVTGLSVWYDRWSDVSGDLIHMAYTESGGSDTLYRTIDTASSDALSTQTTIFAGTSQASGQCLSISRAKGGNVYCKTMIDAGAEGGFYRLPNANVPNGAWDTARTVDETLATTDQCILLPDLTAADTQDMIMLFWDASANEISRKLYDDSGNSWSESSIATSMTDVTANNTYPHWAAAVDIANSRIVMVAWSAVDTLNADLRCWTITNSAITEVTNVVLNSTDDQGLAAIGIDTATGYWWVVYGGKSDGSETFQSGEALNAYCKVSTDAGTTWGPETRMTVIPSYMRWMTATMRFTGPFVFAWLATSPSWQDLRVNVDIVQPQAAYLMGV